MQFSVSVVIPNYNRKNELLRALDSVLSQTLQPDEIIIVDDCSSFSVQDFLDSEKYLPNHKIIVVRNQTNLGKPVAI
jgi:glycosyltransferase involved in cell wall biosynthesis